MLGSAHPTESQHLQQWHWKHHINTEVEGSVSPPH